MSKFFRNQIEINVGKFVIVPIGVVEDQNWENEYPIFICALDDVKYDTINLTIVTCFLCKCTRFRYIDRETKQEKRRFTIRDSYGNFQKVLYVSPKITNKQSEGLEGDSINSVLRYRLTCSITQNFLNDEKNVFDNISDFYRGMSAINFLYKNVGNLINLYIDKQEKAKTKDFKNAICIFDRYNILIVTLNEIIPNELTFNFTALHLFENTPELMDAITNNDNFITLRATNSGQTVTQHKKNQIDKIQKDSGLQITQNGHVIAEMIIRRIIAEAINSYLKREILYF